MAVPKRRTSRANTRSRRAQWTAATPTLVPITLSGTTFRVLRRLVKAVHAGLIDPREI
ncbi:50S ribosomal protein L32 [Rhodococcus sp. HM1]|uniref:50S ribosomal protein L32 n=1 Tax=Rhodococcus sp. HM1 TaxID=2937759 RepID=UPI00200A5E35|nr:50S ribosomal protein L32 [Rhodococcus sp. HM1]MCK8675437.1 50S ribosomal protein L32 [Rhodococcus sp. HM1]